MASAVPGAGRESILFKGIAEFTEVGSIFSLVAVKTIAARFLHAAGAFFLWAFTRSPSKSSFAALPVSWNDRMHESDFRPPAQSSSPRKALPSSGTSSRYCRRQEENDECQVAEADHCEFSRKFEKFAAVCNFIHGLAMRHVRKTNCLALCTTPASPLA